MSVPTESGLDRMKWGVTREDLSFTMDDGEVIWDEGSCVTFLLANEFLLVGTPRSCFFEDKTTQAALWVFCSDTFAYSCADAEELPSGEIGPLTKICLDWGWHGVVKWVAMRRKRRPLGQIVKRMQEEGHWDDELEAIPT